MIQELIKKEIQNFLEEENKRIRERDALNADPSLKSAGVDKNYLQLVENAIAEKDLDKAKAIRNEFELKVSNIQNPTIKDKAAVIGIEINNLIDLEEKIIKNKKDFELRVKNLKGEDSKSFFSEQKQEGMGNKEIQRMFQKGIEHGSENVPKNSFFTSKPDKVTVIQNIITPDQPLPTSSASQQQTQAISQAPPAQMPPVQIMPERIRAEIVKNPKEGHEEEFNKATFLVHELSSYIKEKEWKKAKDEYNQARNLIESLPDCDDKNKLMNELFDDYHTINQLEREWKKEQEELLKRKEAEKKAEEAQEQAKKDAEQKKLDEQRNRRIIEAQEKEKARHQAMQHMQRQASNHIEESIKKKESAEYEAEEEKKIKPPFIKTPDKSFSDVQQRLLEAKHEQILSGGSNTAKFIDMARESLNHDRALREPINKHKNIELPDKPISKDPESIYKQAVSLIYEGNKQRAKELLSELIKMQPNNMAAQIRLKECES